MNEILLDYRTFLHTKQMVAQTAGREVSLSNIHARLFPFQRVLVQWALRKGRAAIFADTGMGKSFMQLEFARLTGERSLILAPLSVARQTVGEATKIGIDAHYTRSGTDLINGVNITNYEMLDHFNPADFGAIILDECFTPDTPIDTPSGTIPIQDIRTGDFISNAIGTDQVSDVHRREVHYAVRVTISGRSIVSSPNHPYFTQRGWVGAQDLQPGDSLLHTSEAMRMVQEGVSAKDETRRKGKTILREILLSEVADAAARDRLQGSPRGSCSQTRDQEGRMVCIGQSQSGSRERANSHIKPDERPECTREGFPPIESHPPQTFRAWWKWDGINETATDITGCTWKRMGSGVCFVTGATDSWVSYALQDRYRQSQAQNRYRSGWCLTSYPQSTRSEEGCEVGFSGVDCLEILEPGHPDLERLRDAEGRIYLYDIGATQHPSFSVNGFLVHNSSILKSLDGETRNKLIALFAQTPYRLCCTATPAPNDVTEIANHAEFLGIMSRAEMLAMFFTHDSTTSAHSGWRLKKHAEEPFYRWMASWSMSVKKPSDLGFDDTGYILPPISTTPLIVETNYTPDGTLFHTSLRGIVGRSRARKSTLDERVERAVALLESTSGQWILWCGRNDESDALSRLLPELDFVQFSKESQA